MNIRYEPCRALFEIELYSDQPFVGAKVSHALYIGKQRFTRRSATALTEHNLIFELTPEEFARVKSGDEVVVGTYRGANADRYEGSHHIRKFGAIDKSVVKLSPLQALGSDDDIARIDIDKLRLDTSIGERPALGVDDGKLEPGSFYQKGYFVPGEDIQSGLREGVVGVCLPYVSLGRYYESASDRNTRLFSSFGPCTGVYLWYVPQKNSFYIWGSCWNSAALGPFIGDPAHSLAEARSPRMVRRTLPGVDLIVESQRLLFADERQARVRYDPHLDCINGTRKQQNNLTSFITRFRLANDSSADLFFLADSAHRNRPFGFRLLRPTGDRGWDRATKPESDNQPGKGAWRRLRHGTSVVFEVIDKGENTDHAFVVLLNDRPDDKNQIEFRAQYPIVRRANQPERHMYLAPRLTSEAQKRAEVVKLKRSLADDPYNLDAIPKRETLVRLLIQLNAPSREIVESTGAHNCLTDPLLYHQLAKLLDSRSEYLDEALEYANWSMSEAHMDGIGHSTLEFSVTLASIHITRGEFDKAVKILTGWDQYNSLAQSYLGFAYEKSGQIDKAIEAYVRAAAGSQYYSKLSPSISIPPSNVRALYLKRYGTLDGLQTKIEAARQTAWQRIHVDPYRVYPASPQWRLPDLAGKVVNISDFSGSIVVLCFVPFEYGPAAQELKDWQDLSVKYKDKGVVFLCVDESRMQPFEERQRSVARVVKELGVTFPTVIDNNETVLKGYNLVTATRVVLLDRNGVLRFNVGGLSNKLGLPRAVKILDYLLKEPSQPQR